MINKNGAYFANELLGRFQERYHGHPAFDFFRGALADRLIDLSIALFDQAIDEGRAQRADAQARSEVDLEQHHRGSAVIAERALQIIIAVGARDDGAITTIWHLVRAAGAARARIVLGNSFDGAQPQ